MAKKRPYLAATYMLLIFGLLALITYMSNPAITGFSILDEIPSNNISSIAGPIVIFIILFSVGIIALKRISKD
ncbi:hypothetical protein KY343_04810 [Candidatus Woesearchaeota archaeon]|nr:hypothetical protein [Candidatus Woesearchaeota archaeon]